MAGNEQSRSARGAVPPPLPRQWTEPQRRVAPAAVPPPLPGTGNPKSAILSPDDLDRFKDLLLFAKTTVDGYFAGKHRSPYPGASAEFRDYKDYVAGDSLDRVDWRAYGRSRRLFIRRYEDETDMVAYLLVDTSASMRYGGGKRPPKFEVASRIAAALAYLMLRQGDKTALGLFAEQLKTYLPPGGTRRHLFQMVRTLESVRPDQSTGLCQALGQCAGVFRKRGRLIVLSDFLGESAGLFDALSQFLHRGYNVLLLQVLDPDEIHLPDQAVAKFVDMETSEEIEVDPDDLRADYRRRFGATLEQLAREAESRRIEHQIVDTAAPYTTALEAYLGFRGKVR